MIIENPMQLLVIAILALLNIGLAIYGYSYIKREHYQHVLAKNHGSINVLDYGAVGDSNTDDTAAFREAFDAAKTYGGAVIIPKRTYVINGDLEISTGMVIISDGATLDFSSGGITAISADDWSLEGLTLTGKNGTGLFISGSGRYNVEKLNVKGFDTGILLTGGKPSRLARGDRGKFSFLSIIGNRVGIQIDAEEKYSAEYNLFTLVSFSGNDTALIITAGNNIFTTTNIVDNKNGVLLKSGLNHGHGIFSGVNINHNTGYSIRAENVANGYSFSGCHIYWGKVEIIESPGVALTGCVIKP